MVVGYLDGRTFTDADLRNGEHLPGSPPPCRRLHAGPAVRRRLRHVRHPAGATSTSSQTAASGCPTATSTSRARSSGSGAPSPYDPSRACRATTTCSPATSSTTATKLWLIDYEYSGNNEACFELGNIWSEAGLTLDQLAELMAAYDGALHRHRVARARLWGLMAKYGWTLWGSIQDAVSDIDFDFWEWAMEKYDRAVAEFEGPDFERLLDEAAGDD